MKRLWLSKYFRPDHNPHADPYAPAVLVDVEGRRYRGHEASIEGPSMLRFDPLGDPRACVATVAPVTLWYEDGWVGEAEQGAVD
jgi:hypothetical protein